MRERRGKGAKRSYYRAESRGNGVESREERAYCKEHRADRSHKKNKPKILQTIKMV
jgi:hypothetical protein